MMPCPNRGVFAEPISARCRGVLERMPRAKSTKKNQVPPKKLATNPLRTTIVVQMAKPAADCSVYFQLWDFVLRFFILILLWFVGMYLQLLVFVLHHFFLLSLSFIGYQAKAR
jgi:hypothetical protein